MEGTFKGLVTEKNTDGSLREKSFGYIATDDDTPDVFVHINALKALPQIKKGMRLFFGLSKTDKGLSAKDVKLAPASPIAKEGRGLVRFWLDKGFGVIEPSDGSEDVTVKANALPDSENGYLSEGYVVDFVAREGEKGLWASKVNVVGWQKPKDPLSAFVDMGMTKWWLNELKELAEKEPWEYKNTPNKEHLPILRNYFRHTFNRLVEMSDGIAYSADGKYASINTGLVTDNQEEIFAQFEVNKRKMQPWQFSGFQKSSSRKFVDNFGSSPPPLADYYDDPSVLIYDRRCDLVIDIDHVMQNIERFPETLQGNPHVAKGLLVSAEVATKKRVYRNYKAAIPQYFRDKGREGIVQLLLPICLLDPVKADLALAAEKSKSGAYRCSTVLTLDMAYNNARLLARPDSEWLQP
jgi:cold shock CspA family protein